MYVYTRDENVPNDDWDSHHRDVEHGRERAYGPVDWEEREWRVRGLWDSRDSLPRSEVHDDDWNSRYDNSVSDWKSSDSRKWDNQSVHIRGHYRNDRSKELEIAESTSHKYAMRCNSCLFNYFYNKLICSLFSKRRTYNSSETRDECTVHSSKQASLYGSMKEEPINKKLMELAEGKLSTTREKSTDTFQKKAVSKEKSETKETITSESKRTCIDESLQTLHTESDLSDISDDPDDILNMEDITVCSIYLCITKLGDYCFVSLHYYLILTSTGYGCK